MIKIYQSYKKIVHNQNVVFIFNCQIRQFPILLIHSHKSPWISKSIVMQLLDNFQIVIQLRTVIRRIFHKDKINLKNISQYVRNTNTCFQLSLSLNILGVKLEMFNITVLIILQFELSLNCTRYGALFVHTLLLQINY